MKILVTGAGGFIGHHLVNRLKADGHWVRGVDIKYPEFEASAADEMIQADLRSFENCVGATSGMDQVFHLASDMGGIGYITANHATLTRNNMLIDCNMLEAARLSEVDRYLYTSSACVYPSFLQDDEDVGDLKESHAIPTDPEKGYGWEKLMAEQLAIYYQEDYQLDIRLVRFHNIYGPLGTWDGGKEKAPAAIMRKISEAVDGGELEIWGDGQQTRSFCYIDDCIDGLLRIMETGYVGPINLGTEEIVSVDQLVDIVAEVAGKSLNKMHDLSKPQGVRGRNSDNTLLRETLKWEPDTRLKDGIRKTYEWIWQQVNAEGRADGNQPA